MAAGEEQAGLEGRDPLDGFVIGQTESISRTITAEDVEAFAKLSGDRNALHIDEEFAARTEFRQRVAHGFLHASILSQLVGMRLPGRGALYLSQSLDFSRPVFIGDTVTARGAIESIERQSRILTLHTEIFNQRGERVLDGRAQVKVLRLRPAAPLRWASDRPETMPTLLAGKTALVTGASRGIGRAVATLLAAHGAHVWINYCKSGSVAEALLTEIAERGGKASLIRADVQNDDDVARMAEAASAEGRIDILVNNAGAPIISAAFERQSWQSMADAYEGIVGATFRVTKAALPHMTGGSKIVNVLTSAALGRTAHNWLPYVTAKSALLGFSKNLAQELGPRGITVNMVSPSLVDTDMVSAVPDKIRQMMVARTPLRRLATVEDVAGAVLLLASPYADFITGDNLLVTGGEVMS
jgi:3-oxoacyl-[acyl-carrier protein] reductase